MFDVDFIIFLVREAWDIIRSGENSMGDGCVARVVAVAHGSSTWPWLRRWLYREESHKRAGDELDKEPGIYHTEAMQTLSKC